MAYRDYLKPEEKARIIELEAHVRTDRLERRRIIDRGHKRMKRDDQKQEQS